MLITFNCEGWDKESAQKYNTLLNTEILPTRLSHTETLAALGLDTDVFETLNAMGDCSPHIGYDNPQAPTYENCSFSFMADGKFCSLSLDQLNVIYEISDERKDVAVENKFTPMERFWDLIATGTGSFASRKAYQSQVRNPTLRVIAKMVSNLLFAKDQTSKHVQTNPGFHLIWMFYTRKDFLFRTDNKKDCCGSLLTPLFKHFRINLQAYAVNYNIEYVDTPYLISCHILRDETTYRFTDKEGNMLFIKLPQLHLTNFSTIENIRFLPEPEFLCADPRAPPPDDDMDEPEDITPNEETAYDLGPLDDDANEAAYRRWMVNSQRKNNSLKKRILKAITGGCFGGQEPQPAAAEEQADGWTLRERGEGNMLFIKLPQLHLTNFSTIENIRFLPEPEFLCADPRAPPPDDDMDEPEDITPNEETAYDLGPLDDDANEAAYRRWMVNSQRKNNSLKKRILKAITGGCFGGQEPQPAAAEEQADGWTLRERGSRAKELDHRAPIIPRIEFIDDDDEVTEKEN
ncbi:hypothetical protein F2Q69_00035687 [Brassica cretica]|uniref:Arabidopsis retrotransposon Orf1 C-terminal domain-containing protein n=1 Tax=Brassica cretica TaxID=69181 RepID=A0A8S9SFL8_BRACR|nr:hypothetical protein F2Q69_00035687 [Brassica cretica]